MVAAGVMSMIVLGVLQGMLQSRRLTEGSIRQATVASLVQGYMEQIKSLKYAATLNALPSSPATTPGTGTAAEWEALSPQPVLTLKDSTQTDVKFYLCAGAAPTSLPNPSTLPTNASFHTESVDIDNISSSLDNCTLNMWIWINDITGVTNLQDCKTIVIVYQYSVKDGGRIKWFTDMTRQIRSIVPTDG